MRRRGFTLIELLVVIAIIALLMGILMPALNTARMLALRMVCGANLRGMGAAMAVYATDNEGDFPRAGGPRGKWTTSTKIQNWDGDTQLDAFGIMLDASGKVTLQGLATISSSFFYLVKYAKSVPSSFVCKADDGSVVFDVGVLNNPANFLNSRLRQIHEMWDFYCGENGMPLPSRYCSYAYAMPYMAGTTSYNITEVTNAAAPVVADRNPHMDKKSAGLGIGKKDNSLSHQGKGQNVLYRNLSVVFERTPLVGIGGDNIYTFGGGEDGTPPSANGGPNHFPVSDKDAFLVSDKNY